jgi:hypothetical protein
LEQRHSLQRGFYFHMQPLRWGLTFFAKERASAIAYVVVTAAVAGGGLLFLTNVIFLHPYPQGGIAGSF